MLCPKCKHKNPKNSKFCNRCGALITSEEAQNHGVSESDTSEERNKLAGPRGSLLCPYRSEPTLRLILDKFNLSPLQIGLLGVFIYYGIVFIFNLVDRTVFPVSFVKSLQNIPFLSNILIPILSHFSPREIESPVLTDITHTVFSAVIPFFGGIVGSYFLRSIHPIFESLKNDRVIDFGKTGYAQFLRNLQKKYDSKLSKIVAFVFGITLFTTFIFMCYSDKLTYWWGHRTYGFAGYYLAFVVSTVMYFAIFGLFVVIYTIGAFRSLFKYPVNLRPFHPDKCNGFRPLGNLIFTLYGLTIVGGMGIFSTFFLGYFGLEKTFIMWLAIITYMLAVPIIFIIPTAMVSKGIKNAKFKLLFKIEDKLHGRFLMVHQKIEKEAFDNEYISQLEEMTKLRENLLIADEISIWPFDIKTIQTIILTYAIQIAIVVFELLRH